MKSYSKIMRSIAACTTLLALLIRTTAQQSTPDSPNIGTSPADGTEAFLQAVPHANASSAIPYRYSLQESQAEWSWTVNVTDISMPLASTNLTNARVAYTTYSFSWPFVQLTLAEMIQYSINSSGVYSQDPRVFLPSHYTVPSNTSGAYNASDAGSCNNVLGAKCVSALLGSISSGKLGSFANNDCQGVLYDDDRTSFFDPSVREYRPLLSRTSDNLQLSDSTRHKPF